MPTPAAPIVVGLGEILWDLLPGGRVLGGAPANCAYHAHALGAWGTVVSAVGSDELGREILARLESAGLTTEYLTVDTAHPTGTVSVELTASGIPRFTWDYQAFSPHHAQLAKSASAVCFGTLAQRTPAGAAMIRNFLDAAGAGTLRVFDINLRQDFYTREVILGSLMRADILKLNDEELPVLGALLGLPEDDEEALGELLLRFDLSMVALTRGEEGSLLMAPGVSSRLRPDPLRVVDSVGAGDAFTAAVVLGLLRKLPLELIHLHASQLASYVCTQPGATPHLPPELTSFAVS
jgi:fructokinase